VKAIDSISVIVPAYNAENHISKCIESLLQSSWKNFELIIVDDGSNDNTVEVINKYANQYENIKLLTKSNGGPSSARNNALKIATGKYVIFVDSDDTVGADLLFLMINSIGYCDISIAGYTSFYHGKNSTIIKKNSPHLPGLYNHTTFSDVFGDLYFYNFINPLWNKLYLRSIIIDNKLEFNENLNLGEDLIFNLAYLQYAKLIKVIDICLYEYNITQNDSLSRGYKKNFFDIQLLLFDKTFFFLGSLSGLSKQNTDILSLVLCISSVHALEATVNMINNYSLKTRVKEIQRITSNKVLRSALYDIKKAKMRISVKQTITFFLIRFRLNVMLYIIYKFRNILHKVLVKGIK
jgi:glycosyltransferase involved in cell wall biosynthesis